MLPFVFYSERSGVWAKKYEPKKWIPRFRFLQSAGAMFFWIFAAIMFLFPVPPPGSPMIDVYLPNTEILILRVPLGSILPVMIMIVVFYVMGIALQLGGVLTSRIYVDAIPNRVRNGVYSLFPTVVLLMSMPQIALFGWLISISIPLTLILVGVISSIGCLLIRKGLQYPHPKELEQDTQESDMGESIYTDDDDLAPFEKDEDSYD
jgi:hypothetical protein